MNPAKDARTDSERLSSAMTLSDMEVFVFPEIFYSLVLANIMSPILWRWRDDPWFKGIHKRGVMAQVNRLKQYIMDRYVFNLDLDTWGMTTKERELARFEGIIDPEILAQSNALFGYEGDKYYFDIDIRRHFGLDKYEGNVIPYWKTETLEAMTSFYRRPGYAAGAGECVSLSALYAAALFVVLGIPLKDIYLLGTPLHSQNYIDIADGVITNNRRIVTKTMWFNGTAISGQARRSMENERITLVAHETGTIHIMYPEASISPGVFADFRAKLSDYLSTPLTPEMLGNFLRQSPESHKCFVVRTERNGVVKHLPLARAFAYERDSSYRVTDSTLPKLLEEVDQEEFTSNPCKRCIVLNDMQDDLAEHPVDIHDPADVQRLKERFNTSCLDAEKAVSDLINFCHVVPKLPDASTKRFVSGQAPLGITPDMTREEIVDHIESKREGNEYCRLAFYAWRDLSRTEAGPFLKAAVERNPVCIEGTATLCATDAALVAHVLAMDGDSIYEEPHRMAQPDEVWNFSMGDGLERAIMLGVILHARHKRAYRVEAENGKARLVEVDGGEIAVFETAKRIRDAVLPIGS
ncbi:MAG: hypothetical protein ACOX9C_03025 [Kiritimatiellia bacterium]|jgi:hypothetical protein